MKLSIVILAPFLFVAHARAASLGFSKARRDTTDTCVYLNHVTVAISPNGGATYFFENTNGCYCVSTILQTLELPGNLLAQNVLAQGLTLADAVGSVESTIFDDLDHEACTYPDYSTPACTQSNPCGFTCNNDFTLSGGDCICMSPRVLLDEVCAPPGSSVDTCAFFNDVDLVVGSITYAEGLEGCYCSSTVLTTLLNNGFGARIVATGGLASLGAAEGAIDDAINSADDNASCIYPGNSAPACTSDNVCGFTCTNDFTLSGGDCVCVSPRVLSDGACVIPGSPGLRRRDIFRDNSGCAWYEDACGIPGEPSSWECLDTRSALESCGGCVYPPPAGLVPDVPAGHQGKDCTEISHAMEISCRASKCVTARCAEGYIVSDDRFSCIPARVLTSNPGLVTP